MIPAKSSLRLVLIAAAVALSVAAGMLAITPSIAAGPNGYAITNVNQRAGPGTEYPVIVTVPTSAPITILGCLGNFAWCDVLYRGNRGWMRSIYLQGFYQGGYYALRDYAPQMRFPIVRFDINAYWGSYYRNRPFYVDRARWAGPRSEGWVNTATFYTPLEPYGDWVWLQGQYVWVPINVNSHWRPYTVGRWVYTNRYGWMWVSSEPFGWATYHYGRWGFSNRIGWFWVPGNRWGPAWVSWRSSNDYLAWAPLPPAYDESVSLNINVSNVPDYYWQVVPSASFLSVNLSLNVVRDRKRFTPILQQTRPLGNVTVNNNVVVNNVVNINYVEEKTKVKVVVNEVAVTKDPSKAGNVEGSAIEIFQPPAEQPPASQAPAEVRKIREVAKESQTNQQAGGQPATEELMLPPDVKPAAGVPPPAESIEQAAPEPGPPPAVGVATPPASEKSPAGLPSLKEGVAAPEASPPPPATGDAAPKTKLEGGAPLEPTPPPAAGERAPPKREQKPKAKKVQPEQVQPQPLPPPPLTEKEEAPPKHKQVSPLEIEPQGPRKRKHMSPPGIESLAPPSLPFEDGPPPQPRNQGDRPKPKQEQPLPSPAEQKPPSPKPAGAPPSPPPPARERQPAPCPEGTMPQDEDGSCVLPPK